MGPTREQSSPNLRRLIPGLAATLCLSIWGSHAYAVTEAGTRILNQAAATYVDLNGVVQDVNSNEVQTLVQQVPGLVLSASQIKPSVANGQVLFPHVLTNTGNGPDSFEICLGTASGAFAFSSRGLFADDNENGLPDSSIEVLDTDGDGCYDFGPLAPGENVSFVVRVTTPDIAATNQQAQFDLTAISDFDNAVNATNTDQVTLIDGPLIELVKTLSTYRGYSGEGGYSVYLDYRNVGNETATNLLIADLLPLVALDGSTGDQNLGMIYTGASADWRQGPANNLTASSIDPLTDAGDADAQTAAGISIIYCAYDASCISPPFASGQVVARIDSVPVGAIGRIRFDFSVDSGYRDDAVLANTATFEYLSADGLETFGEFTSNTVNFVITDEVEVADVVANDSSASAALGVDDSLDANNIVTQASVAQGQPIFFTNYIWNAAANGRDSFDILIDNTNNRIGAALGAAAFPAGTRFTLLREDGRTPLQDSSGNGIPDTGPVEAGAYAAIVVRVDVPASVVGTNAANSNNGWQATLRARSISDQTAINAVTNRVGEIAASSVDLTNDIAGVAGAGFGPEAAPVTTLNIAPGTSGVFLLVVENKGTRPDTFLLDYSSQAPFVSGALPAGWSLTLTQDGGNQDCSVTGAAASGPFVVLPGAANRKIFCASVAIAAQTPSAGAQDLYFRVRSEATGSLDIKRDAVIVVATPALIIEFDLSGQVDPGGTVTYPHVVTNIGNVPLECVNVSLVDSLVAEGWVSQVFLDVDNNGALSAGDVPLTGQTLAIGASFRILVRTFAPSVSPFGVVNLGEVQASGYSVGSGCAGAPVTSVVVDRTTTSNTDMVISKKQALDANCNGIADGAPANTHPSANFSLNSFSVLPGQCVVYRLDATNQGLSILYNAVVRDVVPSFTTYFAAAQQCLSADAAPCNFVNPPANGAVLAPINVASAEVMPGGVVTVFFGIKVN